MNSDACLAQYMINIVKTGHCDFRLRVVCLSPMLRALNCSDFIKFMKITSKMNVISHSITYIIQKHPTFDICRNV